MGTMLPHRIDVVTFIKDQHRDIEDLLYELLGLHGPARARAFFALRRALAVHEAAEETIVHPTARRAIPFGEWIVSDRLDEEHAAKKLLTFLETVDVDSDAFETQFRLLRKIVLAHTALEEKEELEQLRNAIDETQLDRLRKATELVEAIAPTYPHAGMESATANVLGGPFASMVDRVRDALK